MIPVYAISTGKIESLQYKDAKPMQSAINKQPFKDQMWLLKLGFVDDEQAYKDHGGPDKAVCCFSKRTMTCIVVIYLICQSTPCSVRI